jgi:hypothetical protein
MQEDEEAPDAVDVQPYQGPRHPKSKIAHPFPWVVLVAGMILSALIMAAVTISTVPLSFVTAHLTRR